MSAVLVVAAHPDDEVLGCGGTMAKHVAQGDEVHVLFLADGVSARTVSDVDRAIADRVDAARRASSILGAVAHRFLGLPDNRTDTVALLDIVRAIEKAIFEVRPQVLYTHHGGDLNVDHRLAHQAAVTAVRPTLGQSVRAVYAFEAVSSTEWASRTMGGLFQPTRYVAIGDQLQAKLEALRPYLTLKAWVDIVIEIPRDGSYAFVVKYTRLFDF